MDVAARMEQVLGQPQRIAPLDEATLGERERELIARMRDLTAFPREQPIHTFFATLAHQPAFFEAYMQLGITAMGSATLGLRERELLILRTGWLCGAPYQFGEHVISGKAAGLDGDDIERIKQGSSASGWSDADRSLLAAAEELHADAMISEATWASLAAWLAPGELIELMMIVGHYHLTAFIQNSLRFGLNPGRAGLAAS